MIPHHPKRTGGARLCHAPPDLAISYRPPLSWVLRLTLAILPCSRHSCSSSLSFTVDANGLGSKRHHGSAEQGKPYPGANPSSHGTQGKVWSPPPQIDTQHNPLYPCLFTSNHTSLNPCGHINLKPITPGFTTKQAVS